MIPFWKKTDKGGKKTPPKPAIPHTAQQSIPMQRMFEDGTCRVRANYYTRTIAYQDINYQLAQQEDKNAIFEEWCSFLNFFDSSIKFELSFVNMATDSSEFEKSIRIPFQKDGFDDVRAEYSLMLRQQLAKGNNGLTKTKFITFGVEGESMRQVKTRLDHVQNDLLNNFHRLGVQAKPLNGTERLKLMHDMFHMDGESKFRFEWNDLVKSGLSVKDAIAPTAFAFKNSRTFQMGGIYCAASFLSITASDISDQLLKDFLDMDSSQIVTMHIQSVDQNRAIKTVKRTITELDRSKIEEQKKAIRAGYDIDIIPSDLATYGRDAKALLKELQSQNERMFLVTFLVLNTGRTEQELENNVFQASSIAQKHNCNLCRLDYQQEQGLMSSLPLADNQIEIQRGLTTSSTAIFIPFTTQELYQSGKESLYYGLNALSNNLIMVDRKKLKNPNGLILGTPGSGKSFSAKREIANAFLVTDDDIIINDPEGEYSPLVNRLKGQVIKISPNSTQFINPMDINANYSEEDNPLSLKADFILSLCELVVGGKEGLLPVEKTVIDRCVHLIYRKYFADPCPENMPILEDLYNALLQQDEKEAHHVATALEIYVKGSLNLFNHRTNVNVNNRIVCYDIKELGKQMKKLGMLIVQDQVWGRVTANRSSGKSTRYYMDEMHLLLKEEQTAAYSVEIWKRFRKWGGVPTGLTQNVKDLLSSREVENIFENSDMIIMLNQAAGDRQILAKQLNISPHQLSYEVKRGKHPSVKGKGQRRFIRFRTLGAGYTEEEIRAVLDGKAEHQPHPKQPLPEKKFGLLMDIPAKMAEGKTSGYKKWATKFNLKEMSKTLLYLQEKKIDSADELRERAAAATERYHTLGDSIKAAEKRMGKIAVLRAHIVNYAKTRDVYAAYRKAGYSKKFLEVHREEIKLHKAAKAAFDEADLKKLPKVKDLNVEYSELLSQKKAAYPEYRKAKEEMQELVRAQKNVERFFAEEKQTHGTEQVR